MKLLLLPIVFFISLSCSQEVLPTTLSNDAIFEQAIQQCRGGNCTQACELFSQLPANAQTLLNIASCYYAQQDVLHALLFTKKAEKFAGPSLRIKTAHALKSIAKLAGTPISKPQTFWEGAKQRLAFGIYLLQGLGLLWLEMAIIFFWLLLLFAFKFAWLRLLRRGLMLCLLLTGSWTGFVVYQHSLQEGLVMQSNAALVSGPGEDFLHIATLQRADVVQILTTSPVDGFYKVKTPQASGWTKQENIALI